MLFILAWLTGALALGMVWGLVGWMLAHPSRGSRSAYDRIETLRTAVGS